MTVHQSPITVNGWQGSGYSIINPEYGVGAYKISGGSNGGVSTAIGALSVVLGGLFGALELFASKVGDLLRAPLFAAAGRITSVLDIYENFFKSLESLCGVLQVTAVFLMSFLSIILQILAAVLLGFVGALIVPIIVSKMTEYVVVESYIDSECV